MRKEADVAHQPSHSQILHWLWQVLTGNPGERARRAVSWPRNTECQRHLSHKQACSLPGGLWEHVTPQSAPHRHSPEKGPEKGGESLALLAHPVGPCRDPCGGSPLPTGRAQGPVSEDPAHRVLLLNKGDPFAAHRLGLQDRSTQIVKREAGTCPPGLQGL